MRNKSESEAMIQVYETKKMGEYLVSSQINWVASSLETLDQSTIIINNEIKYQEIIGFGASFTDSSAYLFQEVLKEEDRFNVMVSLFDSEKGIGLNMLRNPIGSSDYAREFYNFDESVNDWALQHFTIAPDESGIIPLTQFVKELNPNFVLMASPWSAPGWMKTSNSMIGGSLKSDCYQVYAEYLVKYLEKYQEKGLSIDYITVQNEPLFVPKHYAGMFMSATDQARLIKDYLYPLIRKKELETKIICYDHNWNHPEYPLEVLRKAGECVSGVAWHWYGGRPEAQDFVAQQFPEKEILFTEGSGGEWIPAFEPAFSNLIKTGINILNNGSRNLILWNIALDENNGPTVPEFGRSTCRGLVKINQNSREYEYTLDYYGIAHFSQFVPRGSRRIQSFYTGSEAVYQIAFLTPDQKKVLIIFNDEEIQKQITISADNRVATIILQPKAAYTLVIEN